MQLQKPNLEYRVVKIRRPRSICACKQYSQYNTRFSDASGNGSVQIHHIAEARAIIQVIAIYPRGVTTFVVSTNGQGRPVGGERNRVAEQVHSRIRYRNCTVYYKIFSNNVWKDWNYDGKEKMRLDS